MTAETTTVPATPRTFSKGQDALGLVGVAVIVTLLRYLGAFPEWLHRIPQALIPNFAGWLDAIFNFVKDDLGLLKLTRWLTEGLEWLLDASGNIFSGKRRWPFIGPIPWTALAAVAGVIGYYLGGWRFALLGAGTLVWTALICQWDIAKQTMSVLAIAAPMAFVIGLLLGVAAWKYAWVDNTIKPVLSVLQTRPFFTYLLPAAIFLKSVRPQVLLRQQFTQSHLWF